MAPPTQPPTPNRTATKPVAALQCPLCGGPARLGSTRDIWPRLKSHEPMWLCCGYPRCDAYVRCHASTTEPIGSLAGPRLRRMRQRLHAQIDPLWQNEGVPRTTVYHAIDQVMGTADFHIGWADEAACEQLLRRVEQVRDRAFALDDELHRAQTGYRLKATADTAASSTAPTALTEEQAALLDILYGLAHDAHDNPRASVQAREVTALGTTGQQLVQQGWLTPAMSHPDTGETEAWTITADGWHALGTPGAAS